MKFLAELLFIMLLLGLISCQTVPQQLAGRYVAENGRTTLVLHADGRIDVQDSVPPGVTFAVGMWTSLRSGDIVIESLGERMLLRATRHGGRVTFRIHNPEASRQAVATWNLDSTYLSVREEK